MWGLIVNRSRDFVRQVRSQWLESRTAVCANRVAACFSPYHAQQPSVQPAHPSAAVPDLTCALPSPPISFHAGPGLHPA